MRKVASLVLIFLICFVWGAFLKIERVRSESTDFIKFGSGVTIFSPLNTTYGSRFLNLNMSFDQGSGIVCSMNYSIDENPKGPISLVAEGAPVPFYLQKMVGVVGLPELSEGSHSLTIDVLCGLYDYHGANPPGAPFTPTSPGSSDYIATWTHTIHFTINTRIPEFPSSVNWVEVTRFTENSEFLNRTFTIEHAEWRIRWEYKPNPEVPEEQPALYVYVWDQEHPNKYFETILNKGINETSGTLYFNNRTGTFFLGVIRTVKSFTVIIEQNIDSILEFPSLTILPLALIATLSVIVLKKRLTSKPKANSSFFVQKRPQ